MAHVTVVATIKAKDGQTDRVRDELLRLIAPTLSEQGCMNYDLHQDNQDPSLFVFYENWQSQDSLDAHSRSQHLEAFRSIAEPIVERWEVHRMSKIG